MQLSSGQKTLSLTDDCTFSYLRTTETQTSSIENWKCVSFTLTSRDHRWVIMWISVTLYLSTDLARNQLFCSCCLGLSSKSSVPLNFAVIAEFGYKPGGGRDKVGAWSYFWCPFHPGDRGFVSCEKPKMKPKVSDLFPILTKRFWCLNKTETVSQH